MDSFASLTTVSALAAALVSGYAGLEQLLSLPNERAGVPLAVSRIDWVPLNNYSDQVLA
jgi:hypothetical protein